MQLTEMNACIHEELEHIPRREPDKFKQGQFRAFYQNTRAHQLKENPLAPPGRALHAALDDMKKHYPNYAPRYNASYFCPSG